MKQTALITGGSKRIGKALALHLAAKGWSVAIHYNTSEERAKELANKLSAQYPQQQFVTIQTNLADISEVADLVPTAKKALGEIHLLINNASVFNPGYLKKTTLDLFDTQMDVNFKAPFFLIRDFANQSVSGCIVNFVDTRITANKSNFAAYALSKKALWELTKMAALELAPSIRVNAIAPGATLPPENEDEQYLFELAKGIPMKKPGGLVPILNSLDFILDNNHLTGQLLFADGGENLGQNV